MMIKNPKTIIPLAAIAGTSALAIYYIRRAQWLREDVDHSIIERIHERLDNIEKQFLLITLSKKAQENIHAAIVHTNGWGYFCDTEGMIIKLEVSISMLEEASRKDPLNKRLYERVIRSLKECISDIEEVQSKPNLIDKAADWIKYVFKWNRRPWRPNIEEEKAERLNDNAYRLTKERKKRMLGPLYPIWGE